MNFIGVDWGSSAFRAYLIAPSGQVVDRMNSSAGVKHCAGDQFAQMLQAQIGQWLEPNIQVYLSGMVTSKRGWVDTDYLSCPCSISDIAEHVLTSRELDADLRFLPGICQQAPWSDVMRGEELQMHGIAGQAERRLVLLPGTHSKWANLQEGRIERFATLMTGELYDLVLKHSLAGQLAEGEEPDIAAFENGVSEGLNTVTPVHHLFQARSRVLMKKLEPIQVAGFLSGFLIGNEIREGLDLIGRPELPALLVGNPDLVKLYSLAFEQCQIAVDIQPPDLAVSGFYKIHQSSIRSLD